MMVHGSPPEFDMVITSDWYQERGIGDYKSSDILEKIKKTALFLVTLLQYHATKGHIAVLGEFS